MSGDLYMVDTHALFWYLVGSSRLSKQGAQIFQKAYTGEAMLILSPIVLLELYGLARKVNAPFDFAGELALFEQPPFLIETVTVADLRLLERLNGIPELHDRLIAATALRLGVPILTCDPAIRACPEVTSIW